MNIKLELVKIMISARTRHINELIIDTKNGNGVFLKDDELKEYKDELQNLQDLADKIGFTLN